MTIEEQIGIRVKRRRKELKMSQSALSDLTHLSRQYIYEIETGKKSITINTLEKLKKALRVHYSYFFSGSEANS